MRHGGIRDENRKYQRKIHKNGGKPCRCTHIHTRSFISNAQAFINHRKQKKILYFCRVSF